MAPVVPFDVMKLDLEIKLSAVVSERETIQQRLAHLDQVEQALNLLIAEESQPAQAQLVLLPPPVANGHQPIGTTINSRFILESLVNNSLSLDTLAERAVAMGIDFGEKSPKRVFHYTLIGLQRNGYTLMTDKLWGLTQKALDNMPVFEVEGQEHHELAG